MVPAGCRCLPKSRRASTVVPFEVYFLSASNAPQQAPLVAEELPRWVAPDGSISDVEAVIGRIYSSGIEPGLRPRLWLHLLGVAPWDASTARLETLRAEREAALQSALGLWTGLDAEGRLDECKHGQLARYHRIVDVDVPRTDRELPQWASPESVLPIRRVIMSSLARSATPGYFQGMCDMAAVLLHALDGSEADALACYEALLDLLSSHFEDEQQGIWRQSAAVMGALGEIDPKLRNELLQSGSVRPGGECLLLFQPIFLVLKREIGGYADVCAAWELWWAAANSHAPSGPCMNFQLVLVLAFLELKRGVILGNKAGVVGLTKIFHASAGTFDSFELLVRARAVHAVLVEHTALGVRPSGTATTSSTSPGTRGAPGQGAVHAILTSKRLIVAPAAKPLSQQFSGPIPGPG